MGIEKQGAKPSGRLGRLFGQLMNRFHTPLYRKYFDAHPVAQKSSCIDLGCGGGSFLNYLDSKNQDYQLYGLDHSKEMSRMCVKVNNAAVDAGRMQVFCASVGEIPLSTQMVDLATAFESVQFWPDTNAAFAEVFRVLKPGGMFVIINRFPKEGAKWWKLAKLKSEQDFREYLTNAGFKHVRFDFAFKKGWIIVKAKKDTALEK